MSIPDTAEPQSVNSARRRELPKISSKPDSHDANRGADRLNLVTLSQTTAQEKTNSIDLNKSESVTYKRWFDGYTKGTLSYEDALKLAREYLRDYGDTKKFKNSDQVRFMTNWLDNEQKRPLVKIDLRDFVRSNRIPTNNELGLRIARAIGFTEGEIKAYAGDKEKDPASCGEAFYGGSKVPSANKYWLDQAKRDPYGGYVSIPEFNTGAIQGLRTWRDRYRAAHGPQVDWNLGKLSPTQDVLKHVAIPAANFGYSALNSTGDLVQGLGLLAHAFKDKTFMDDFAEYLRKKGDSLPMNSLYSDEEMRNGVVQITNTFALAAGSGIVYMIPGSAIKSLQLAPEVQQMVSNVMADVMGAAGNAGQVYNASLSRQALEFAREELASGKIKEEDLGHRVEEIKEGKIEAEQRKLMERKALVSAAFAAPVGAINGKLLSELGEELFSGVTVEKLPEELVRDLFSSLAKGGALSESLLISNEELMALTRVQSARAAGKQIDENLLGTVIGGALLFAIENQRHLTTSEHAETQGEREHRQAGSGVTPEPTANEILAPYRPVNKLSLGELVDYMDRWKALSESEKEQFLAQYKSLEYIDRSMILRRIIQEGLESVPESVRRSIELQAVGNAFDIPADNSGSEMLRLSSDFTRDAKAMFEPGEKPGEADLSAPAKTEALQQRLQSLSDTYADRLGIPRPRVQLIDADLANSLGIKGDYTWQTNTIRLDGSLAKPWTTLAHELTHAEQYALVLRHLADKLGIGSNPSEEDLRSLNLENRKSSQLNLPADDYIFDVLKNHRKPLSVEESLRAQKLRESFEDMEKNGQFGFPRQGPDEYRFRLQLLEIQLKSNAPFFAVARELRNSSWFDVFFNSRPEPAHMRALRINAERGNESAKDEYYRELLPYVQEAIRFSYVEPNAIYRVRQHEREAHAVSDAIATAAAGSY